jgi:undecaprenyl diphosphate synthase
MSSATRSPETLGRIRAAGLDPDRLPRHIAVIMDGNGRWAQERGLPRHEGHRRGVRSVRATIEECCRLGIGQLTLYCLSSENWKRPQAELDFLMALLHQYLIEERAEIMEQNIRFTTIGKRSGLPPEVLAEIDENVRLSRDNTGLVLCLAINYGSRQEIVDGVRALAERVRRAELDPADIDEELVGTALYTSHMPDPDLLVRTAGEMRVSNFLLWQISYAELWVTPRCWPDFDVPTLHQALHDFANRERRFGGLPDLG